VVGWTRALNTSYVLSTIGGLGLRFDGIGAISGGGATSKLLIAYPEPQRGEVLDLLFKPNYGASLQMLKVEIGGDGQATEGSESSHMHTADDESYERGYEWWLMREAKARRPPLLLYGLPWTFPGWLTASGQGGRTGNSNLSAIAQVLTPVAADYVARWVAGAKQQHNLSIDYLGLWNEHPPTADYAVLLRRALDALPDGAGAATSLVGPDWHTNSPVLEPFLEALRSNATVRAAIARVGFHYPHRFTPALVEKLGPLYQNLSQPVWASEESSTTDDVSGGACWARILCQNYAMGKMTASIMWNLVTSYYASLPYWGASIMNAAEPWSGHYQVMTPVWATAHHTQFAQPGWTYLAHGSGVGTLSGGGSFVTYLAPSSGGGGREWSVVAEKITASSGPCLRDSFHNDTMAREEITFVLSGELRADANMTVQVWRSDWSKGQNGTSEADLFQPGATLRVAKDGATGRATVSVTLGSDEVVTLSSLPRSVAGRHPPRASPVPKSQPFPDEYRNDFEATPLEAEDPFLTDQAGKWEVATEDERAGASNRVLRHVCTDQGVVYRGDVRPISVLGSPLWVDTRVSFRFKLEDAAAAGVVVALRTTPIAGFEPTNLKGAYVIVRLDGTVAFANSTYAVGGASGGGARSGPPVDVQLDTWYGLNVSIDDSLLRYTLGDGASGTAISSGSCTLDRVGSPLAGQLAIGLVDYGRAAIDDLVVSGTQGASASRAAV
jgi:galactosylceramidase